MAKPINNRRKISLTSLPQSISEPFNPLTTTDQSCYLSCLAGSSPNQDPHWSVSHSGNCNSPSCPIISAAAPWVEEGSFKSAVSSAPPSVTIQELPPSPALVTQQLFPLDLPFFPLSTFPPTSSPQWTFPPNIVPLAFPRFSGAGAQ